MCGAPQKFVVFIGSSKTRSTYHDFSCLIKGVVRSIIPMMCDTKRAVARIAKMAVSQNLVGAEVQKQV
jgi:hypothetical protein